MSWFSSRQDVLLLYLLLACTLLCSELFGRDAVIKYVFDNDLNVHLLSFVLHVYDLPCFICLVLPDALGDNNWSYYQMAVDGFLWVIIGHCSIGPVLKYKRQGVAKRDVVYAIFGQPQVLICQSRENLCQN